jgi:hypothetical protein
MKNAVVRLGLWLIVVLLVSFSCKEEAEPLTAEQRVTAVLTSGTWKVKSLYIDGIESKAYADLTLNFTTTSFTAANGVPMWPTTGTWSFLDDSAVAIKRNDDVYLNLNVVDDNTLELNIFWSIPSTSFDPKGSHTFLLYK